MVRLVYSILVAICMPFVLLRLWMRGFKAPEYRTRRLERMGFFKAPESAQDIWLHAVSVGELLAAEPIIRELQRRFPEKRICVTTMTPTSSALLAKLFGESVFHVYAPYDLPLFVNAFLKRIRPSFVIIMETELWPNMIHRARALGCPVVLANARLSERSARGYRRLLPMVSWLFNSLQMVLCQYQPDAERFETLGIPKERIRVTGSLKFDFELDPSMPEQGKAIRADLSASTKVWVAASTHEGEDARILAIHKKIKQRLADVQLILVPRHPERFDSAYDQSCGAGFKVGRYSERPVLGEQEDVYVLDTMGKLMAFYAASDVVFIGGSLTPVGGHNPIEPGALGKPMLIGPHYFNFQMICEEFVQAGALQVASSDDQLTDKLIELLNNPEDASRRGTTALEIVEKGKGATGRVVDFIASSL